MRKPRSFFEAAVFGILTGINPFSRTGHPVLDTLYLVTSVMAVGLFLAQLAAGCTPAYAGCAFPTPSTFSTTSTIEPAMDVISTDFLWALAGVESGHNDAAYNPAEGAVGRFQIRACYLADANEALGTAYTLQQMSDPRIAMEVVRAYLTRWGAAYERRTGHPATAEVLARIHNGGPRGAEKDCTLAYAKRFAKEARL